VRILYTLLIATILIDYIECVILRQLNACSRCSRSGKHNKKTLRLFIGGGDIDISHNVMEEYRLMDFFSTHIIAPPPRFPLASSTTQIENTFVSD